MSGPLPQHPAVTDGTTICGIVHNPGGAIERICINPPHDTERNRGRRQGTNNAYVAEGRRHYFVRRWPNRVASTRPSNPRVPSRSAC